VCEPRELPGGDALNVQEADHSSQAKECHETEALDVELGGAVERLPAHDLDQHHDHPPAVKGEERQQVGEAQRDREQGDKTEVGVEAEADRLVGDVGDAHWVQGGRLECLR